MKNKSTLRRRKLTSKWRVKFVDQTGILWVGFILVFLKIYSWSKSIPFLICNSDNFYFRLSVKLFKLCQHHFIFISVLWLNLSHENDLKHTDFSISRKYDMFSVGIKTSSAGLIACPIARLNLVVARIVHFLKYNVVNGIEKHINGKWNRASFDKFVNKNAFLLVGKSVQVSSKHLLQILNLLTGLK